MEEFCAIRFWQKVDKTDTCWVWGGALNAYGYGHAWYKDRIQRAHRVSYELCHGGIPQSLIVLHTCDNRACVNPVHLVLGTQQDNMRSMSRKGRRKINRHPPGSKNPSAKLSLVQVAQILDLLSKHELTQTQIAAICGVHKSTISNLFRHKSGYCHELKQST